MGKEKDRTRSIKDQRRSQCFAHVLFFICLWSSISGNLSPEPPVNEPVLTSKCESMLPECECDDDNGVALLVCRNVSDFEVFTHVLKNGSLFEEGSAYDITLSGTRILPRQFLKGLSVYHLVIDDPKTEGLEKAAFDGNLRLRRFHVATSSITNIPDFRPIRDSLRLLNLDNSLLTTVEGDHLKNLPHLQAVSFVNNSIKYVAADAFQDTENVLIFDISHNQLQFLPPHLFDPWKKLKKAVISHNHLLHVNQLFAVTHPNFIYLEFNNLTDLYSVLYPNMSTVVTVSLGNNPISKVTANSFNGKLINTRFLFLDHCLIKDFNSSHYAQLRFLHVLDLSHNLIEKVGDEEIILGKNTELDLIGNRISEFNAILSSRVKCVFLNKNNLTTVGKIFHQSQKEQVSISDNLITSLDSEDFIGAHGLMMLDMEGNRVSRIERNTFSKLRSSLIHLDFSRNKIRKLDGCFKYLSMLTSLNLTDNEIETFEEGEFKGLNELTDLSLRGNRIETLGQEVRWLPRLKNLVISNNRIRTILDNQIPDSLRYIHVHGNPVQCDCQILSFLRRVNSTKNLKTDMPLCIPTHPTSSIYCPDGCRCYCSDDDGDHFISVDCSSTGMTQFPSLLTRTSTPVENKSTALGMLQPRYTEEIVLMSESAPFVIQDKIGSLNLSHNNLQSLEEARLPGRLKYLLLDHNNIQQSPPVTLLRSFNQLSVVSLSGNPWSCDCGAVAFQKWILFKSENIMDVNETRCGSNEPSLSRLDNRSILSLADLDLCPSYTEIYVWVVIGVLSFLLFAAAIIIAWSKYGMYVRVWMYGNGMIQSKRRDIDQDKLFDAFISYNDEDVYPVVQELINEIERKEPNARLCLRCRDFQDGVYNPENIIKAIENSKRTIVVLSRNFIESEWCMFEFRTALNQSMRDRIQRIIFVKLEKFPKESKIPEVIEIYLKSSPCITWGDTQFFNNLMYNLSTSNRPRPEE